MDFSSYSDLTVEMAVDLVNTLDGYAGEDRLTSVGDLESFLGRYERDWHAEDWHPGEPTETDVAAARELRETLRAVLASDDALEAAELLNGVLARAQAIPRISVHRADPHLHFEPIGGSTAEWLAAATAMGLGVVLCDYGVERFGTCAAHDCVDVFVDTSKNRSRRHCSSTCSTRENVAAYRRRARSAD